LGRRPGSQLGHVGKQFTTTRPGYDVEQHGEPRIIASTTARLRFCSWQFAAAGSLRERAPCAEAARDCARFPSPHRPIRDRSRRCSERESEGKGTWANVCGPTTATETKTETMTRLPSCTQVQRRLTFATHQNHSTRAPTARMRRAFPARLLSVERDQPGRQADLYMDGERVSSSAAGGSDPFGWVWSRLSRGSPAHCGRP
jgi:hypothetical protein